MADMADVVKKALDEMAEAVKQELDTLDRQLRAAEAASAPGPCIDFVDQFLSIGATSGFLEAQYDLSNHSVVILTAFDGQQYRYNWGHIFRPCLAGLASAAYGLTGRKVPWSEAGFSFYGFEAEVDYPTKGGNVVPLHIKTLNSGHNSVPMPHFYFCISRA